MKKNRNIQNQKESILSINSLWNKKDVENLLGKKLATKYIKAFLDVINGKYLDLKNFYPPNSIIKINNQKYIIFSTPFLHFIKFYSIGWFNNKNNREILLKKEKFTKKYFD